MIKLLPFIVIPVLIVLGLLFWRYIATNKNLATPAVQQDLGLVEVPKTLPNATLEDRVKVLEDTNSKLITQINGLKTSNSGGPSVSSLDSRLTAVEGATTDLKVRISALEKATPVPAAVAKSTIYIPLGSGGTVASIDWTSLNSFQISLDPVQYPGYSSMQLEVNMRLNQPGGTLYARLYNSTSGSAISSEISSTSTNSSVHTSSTFTLPAGSKTYVLQAKTSDANPAFLDTARIKVSF